VGLLNADVLVGLLGAAEHNHQVIANNLANVNTPGYRTARMRFAEQLEELIDGRGALSPGAGIETTLYRPLFATTNADGNDVVLEREIVELNKNTLRMRLYLAMLGGRIRRLRSAIAGR